MLITGVAPEVREGDLAPNMACRPVFACCIDLGDEAVDTRSNARETAAWVRATAIQTVRLVTSDWHMPRARRWSLRSRSRARHGRCSATGWRARRVSRTLVDEYQQAAAPPRRAVVRGRR